jgi:hypothetical protein
VTDEPALDRLVSLAPPPARDVRETSWTEIEEAIGLRLPDDYKAFTGLYGFGQFDDFLYVYVPGARAEEYDLLARRQEDLETLRELGPEPETPADPEVRVGGLLPWGTTDNGDVFFWYLRSGDPSTWTVLVNEGRAPVWHRYAGSMTEFLVDVLTGAERVEVFPEDFPPESPHHFASLP